MSERGRTPMRVECTECLFSRVVDPTDGALPADVVVEHGRETGHTLETSALGEDS